MSDKLSDVWRTHENASKTLHAALIALKEAKENLDWTPKISLDEGIKKTIEWYRKNIR